MSNLRIYKNKIDDFKNTFEEIINNTNFFNIKEKTKNNTQKDIYEDLRKQVNRYKQIMRNSRDIELDETEETRRTEEITQQNNEHEAVQREQRKKEKQEQRIEPIEFIQSNIMNQNNTFT